MKLLNFPLAAALLAIGAVGCGATAGTGTPLRSTTPHRPSTSATTTRTTASDTVASEFHKAVDSDQDDDVGAASDDANHANLLSFGDAATPSERRPIATLLRRYYAAAATEDGARACSLLYSRLAESVPEDYGVSPPGPAYMKGETCPAALTALFKHIHTQAVAEKAAFEAGPIRLEGLHGFAVLDFAHLPERQIVVRREGGSWKVVTLFDSPLP